jgi:hypothetical protein
VAKTKSKKKAAKAPKKKKPELNPTLPEDPEFDEGAGDQEPDETADEEEETSKKRDTRKKSGKRGIGPAETDETTAGEAASPKRGRQARLPEMEDEEIEELEECAERYVELRNKRQQWGAQEIEAKTELLALMKSNGKTTYNHAGCEIDVIVEKEKVRVRFRKEEE